MWTELAGKGGRLCEAAREGRTRCPLIVRPTSEDVITGQLVGAFRVLDPMHWVPDLLDRAVGSRRFRRQVFRRFRVDPWKTRPHFPKELLPWAEGGTQVDVTLAWENPPTTILLEMKFGAELAPTTANGKGHEFPSDQLIRTIRVGLHECGYYRSADLFDTPPRDLAVIVLSPTAGHPLVARYRDVTTLRAAIPHADRIPALPRTPFVGELGYADLVDVLRQRRRHLTRAERQVADDLCEYLEFKRASAPKSASRTGERPERSLP